MKKLIPLLLLLISATALADWVKIKASSDPFPAKFIDLKAIRQTGPMNTMRRVWELNNLAKSDVDKILSIKNYMEYDCKDRRTRVLEQSNFSEHWAQGENLGVVAYDVSTGNWRDIGKGSVSESIFNRVCPSDEPDADLD